MEGSRAPRCYGMRLLAGIESESTRSIASESRSNAYVCLRSWCASSMECKICLPTMDLFFHALLSRRDIDMLRWHCDLYALLYMLGFNLNAPSKTECGALSSLLAGIWTCFPTRKAWFMKWIRPYRCPSQKGQVTRPTTGEEVLTYFIPFICNYYVYLFISYIYYSFTEFPPLWPWKGGQYIMYRSQHKRLSRISTNRRRMTYITNCSTSLLAARGLIVV